MKQGIGEYPRVATSVALNIDLVRAGDTVLHGGKARTVCVSDIKTCPSMGRTLFGDSYCLGYRPVRILRFTTLTAVTLSAVDDRFPDERPAI